MKYKNIYRFFILLCFTFVGMWAIPSLLKMILTTSPSNAFVCYSSVLNKFLIKESIGKQVIIKDSDGNDYSEKQFETLTPLMNHRQLIVSGTMPDSINGKAVPIKLVKSKNFYFRYNPKEINSPKIGLYILYEALSGKLKLESPGDVFRLKNNIEFIDATTNTIIEDKSILFQDAFIKAGYTFPAQWTEGNLNIRKPYDEGYFSLDADGEFFHFKMVNGRPYVRDTKIGEQIKSKFFSMLEVADKRFYGFLFDEVGCLYIIELQDGEYVPLKLDIPAIDMNNDEVLIMANMLFWTINVKTTSGKQYYALNNDNLSKVDEMFIKTDLSSWTQLSSYIMPYYFTINESNTNYLKPYIHFTAFTAIILNSILALFSLLIKRISKREKFFNLFYILFTGIAGALAILLVPKFSKNK